MNLIKPDHDRRIDIPGVPAPVRRPVDIDQTKTGFAILRTLRIYRFDEESVIEGHAEEDEVFLVVITGSVELTMIEATALPFSATLSAGGAVCAAYLPPHAAYKLIAKTEADVAYARATPSSSRRAKVFSSAAKLAAPGVTVVLEESAYADRLRLRLVQFDAREHDVVFQLMSEIKSEGLVHIRTQPEARVAVVNKSHASSAWLDSWDTLAPAPGDDPILQITEGSSGLALIVTARSE